ncbi:TetR/AcrR family transcriptional regulator [Erwinia sp. HR93]|uniref:TetR/AcrR family transcriptional regulator n=1 Tax=Erwinia sp. HR93 TaxID=3094840 RepID=UPI002ADEE3BC|nr:TetR/AcrR family transcriptional regulator [Erwinia sp. HR93]MEA1064992.1 TetR/AcrR family transcriptional regulator [Erwinia sp. HR93]
MERKSIDENKKRKPSGAAVIQASLTRALYKALFEEWASHGYTGIRLDRVASRAGAGKAAIYRRWVSKREFAAEAIAEAGLLLASVEDCGSLEKDISAFLMKLRATFRHPLVRRILPDMHAERTRNGELANILTELADRRRKIGVAIFERAIARGELSADLDIENALSLLPAMLYWEIVVLGKPVSRKKIEQQVENITLLLKHGR